MVTNEQRLVLITGANRGIGHETAKQLAGRGWHVVIGARNEQSGLRAAEKINASGGRATFLPFLRRSPAARVINVSSGYGQLEGLSLEAPSYCLSKLALNGATILLAQALRSDGIAVNSMCPGWVRTDMGGPNATRSLEQG